MKILILGAGDLSSGIALRLKHCGHDIIMTETDMPTCVRRSVSFAEAVYNGSHTIEDVTSDFVTDWNMIDDVIKLNHIAVISDEQSKAVNLLKPDILIDARMAKINLGITADDAPYVIAIGPGFCAGKDCHAVIETKRGHTLGRVIYSGYAIPNTGIPGNVGGYTTERLISSTAAGIFHPIRNIGDSVNKGEAVAYVETDEGTRCEVYANLTGVLRGILHDGVKVTPGMKSGDVDARCEKEYCFSVSDKALSIAGGVLEAIYSSCCYVHGN